MAVFYDNHDYYPKQHRCIGKQENQYEYYIHNKSPDEQRRNLFVTGINSSNNLQLKKVRPTCDQVEESQV